MNATSIGKACRLVGVLVNIAAVGLLVWYIVDVHHQRSRRPYWDPETDEQTIITGYLRVLICVGVGCFLLWLGSRFSRPSSGVR
jgi:hypothetical protein